MNREHISKTPFVIIFGALALLTAGTSAMAQAITCPRFSPGSPLKEPPSRFSEDGVLSVSFKYETITDQNNNVRFCFMTEDGQQAPTLHVKPGDHIVMTVTNDVPAAAAASIFSAGKVGRYRPWSTARLKDMLEMHMHSDASTVCGDATQTATSVNVHFHGTNTPPICHQDEVIHTLINSGNTFRYDLAFPDDEPPGLYWYHPHVHGLAEAAVQGGASGAIIVEGLQNVNPDVAGLRHRVLVIRDNPVPGSPSPGGAVPSWDLSVNYIPVPFPNYPTALVTMEPGERQLWRVVNACADTILDLQLQFDGVAQPVEIVALDGVPTGSQDGTSFGKGVTKTDVLIPPAGRAEFIVTGPSTAVQKATLLTLAINTGPDGDDDPTRPLVSIQTTDEGDKRIDRVAAPTGPPPKARFAGLATATPTLTRNLYFDEKLSDPNNPLSPTSFFITVQGAPEQVFEPTNPPAIVTTQGSVEDWIIENHSLERHEFHMHQIHFLLLERNGVPVPASDMQYLDMVDIPFWSGSGPYPSVKVRMDFRGPDIGQFVYHCHILGHEDNGMMAIIQVNPASSASNKAPARSVKTGGGSAPAVEPAAAPAKTGSGQTN